MTPGRFWPILFLGILSMVYGEDKRIVLAYPSQAMDTEEAFLVRRITEEAFRRLGYELVREYYPQARCGLLANSGQVDGLPRRVEGYNNNFPNLLPVKVPILTVNFSAYVSDPEIIISNWESFREREYRVAFVDGMQYSRKNLTGLVPEHRLYPVQSHEAGLKMLQYGRVDIFVDMDENADHIIKGDNELRATIHKTDLSERIENYIYLHKEHEGLILPLENILVQMNGEGLFQ